MMEALQDIRTILATQQKKEHLKFCKKDLESALNVSTTWYYYYDDDDDDYYYYYYHHDHCVWYPQLANAVAINAANTTTNHHYYYYYD